MKHQWKQVWQDVHTCVLCNATYSDKTAEEICPKAPATIKTVTHDEIQAVCDQIQSVIDIHIKHDLTNTGDEEAFERAVNARISGLYQAKGYVETLLRNATNS